MAASLLQWNQGGRVLALWIGTLNAAGGDPDRGLEGARRIGPVKHRHGNVVASLQGLADRKGDENRATMINPQPW